jgi:multiple sugar transport system ATP-binding protein
MRPEYLRLAKDEVGGASVASLRAHARLVERLGSEILVYFDLTDSTLVAKMDSEAGVQAGDTCTLDVNMARVHLFDPETERRIQ